MAHTPTSTQTEQLLSGLPRCRRCAEYRADVSPRSRVCQPCQDASPSELAQRILAPIHRATDAARRRDIAAAQILQAEAEAARRAIALAASLAALESRRERGEPVREHPTDEPHQAEHGPDCDCVRCFALDLRAHGDTILSPWPSWHDTPRLSWPKDGAD